MQLRDSSKEVERESWRRKEKEREKSVVKKKTILLKLILFRNSLTFCLWFELMWSSGKITFCGFDAMQSSSKKPLHFNPCIALNERWVFYKKKNSKIVFTIVQHLTSCHHSHLRQWSGADVMDVNCAPGDFYNTDKQLIQLNYFICRVSKKKFSLGYSMLSSLEWKFIKDEQTEKNGVFQRKRKKMWPNEGTSWDMKWKEKMKTQKGYPLICDEKWGFFSIFFFFCWSIWKANENRMKR